MAETNLGRKCSAIPVGYSQVNFHEQLYSIFFTRKPSLNQSAWLLLAKSHGTNMLETSTLVSNKTWHNFKTVQSTL